MAKQTYSIKAGSIAALCRVCLAGHVVVDVVHMGDGLPDDYQPQAVYIPQAVKDAVNAYFVELFARGLPWLTAHFSDQIAGTVVKIIKTPAARNIPGTLVDVRFPDGWRSGFIVSERVPASDRAYRLNVNTLKGASLDAIAPECVRKSARSM